MSTEYFTVTEWLSSEGIDLSRAEKVKLGVRVAKAYRDQYGEEPQKIYRSNSLGKQIKVGNGYRLEDSELIKQVYLDTFTLLD